MNKRLVKIGVIVLVIVMAFGVIGSAAAQGPDDGRRRGGPIRDRVTGALIDAVSDALGITPQEVLQAVRDGKTVAEVLQENGIEPGTVLETVKTVVSEELAQAVADGKITQEQADRVLEGLDEALENAINRVMDRPAMQNPLAVRESRVLAETVAEMTGMDAADVLQALRDGKTLSEIAAENGVDPATVVEAALAKTSETLAQAVAEGKITQERADEILAQATEFYPQAMERTLPDRSTPVRDRVLDNLENTLFGVLAEAAGVEPGELLREVFAPPTLAEVATEYGLDADALIAEAEARITATVNQAVTDGKITQEQADQVLDGLHERLVERFNSPFRLRPNADRQRPARPSAEAGV